MCDILALLYVMAPIIAQCVVVGAIFNVQNVYLVSSVLAVAWLTPINPPISTPMALSVVTIASVSCQPQTAPITPMKVAIAGKAISPAHFNISYIRLLSKYVLLSIGFPSLSVFVKYRDGHQCQADDCRDSDRGIHGLSFLLVLF